MDEESVPGSVICAGSHLNRRVFDPEDPCLTLESTILAGGNVTLLEDSSSDFDGGGKQQVELSTVAEEKDRSSTPLYPSIELEPIVDDNVLNMNIDAISDDDVFFDCTTSPCPSPRKCSPCPSPRKFSPCGLQSPRKCFSPDPSPRKFFDSIDGKNSSPKSPRGKIKRSATPRFGQFLLVENCAAASSPSFEATADTNSSSSVEAGQRTGGLIVQIVDDFNDMKDHAQSTPKLDETDSGYFQLPAKSEGDSKCSGDQSKSPAAGDKQRPPVPPRKRSLGPPRRSPTGKPKSPTYKTMSSVDPSNKENYYRGQYSRAVTDRMPLRPRRVILMKQFFESRILSESQSTQKLPAKSSSSSSIHYKTTLRKSPRMYDLRSSGSEVAEVSSRKKRSSRSRPSSCSEISSTESSVSRATINRSKSTSDATTDNSADRIKTQRLNNIVVRRYAFKPVSQRTTLHANSPKDSTIKKRRSFGLVSSPIKPVREIRKIFSPRYQANKTEITKNKTKMLKTPRIIYTNEK